MSGEGLDGNRSLNISCFAQIYISNNWFDEYLSMKESFLKWQLYRINISRTFKKILQVGRKINIKVKALIIKAS